MSASGQTFSRRGESMGHGRTRLHSRVPIHVDENLAERRAYSEEWAHVPYLLRDNAEKLISEGMIDPEKISAALVNIIRQTEQIRRSEKRVNGS